MLERFIHLKYILLLLFNLNMSSKNVLFLTFCLEKLDIKMSMKSYQVNCFRPANIIILNVQDHNLKNKMNVKAKLLLYRVSLRSLSLRERLKIIYAHGKVPYFIF